MALIMGRMSKWNTRGKVLEWKDNIGVNVMSVSPTAESAKLLLTFCDELSPDTICVMELDFENARDFITHVNGCQESFNLKGGA